jgi:hypothetical protein
MMETEVKSEKPLKVRVKDEGDVAVDVEQDESEETPF